MKGKKKRVKQPNKERKREISKLRKKNEKRNKNTGNNRKKRRTKNKCVLERKANREHTKNKKKR